MNVDAETAQLQKQLHQLTISYRDMKEKNAADAAKKFPPPPPVVGGGGDRKEWVPPPPPPLPPKPKRLRQIGSIREMTSTCARSSAPSLRPDVSLLIVAGGASGR